MKAVVQRVSEAAVVVEGREVSRIGPGLLVLLAVVDGDAADEVALLVRKVVDMRIFRGEGGGMDRSVAEENGSLLVVSQFTLAANLRKGRRPDFTRAARPEQAEPLVELFSSLARERGIPAQAGVFGAMMKVSLVNDGPVTMILDTDVLKGSRKSVRHR